MTYSEHTDAVRAGYNSIAETWASARGEQTTPEAHTLFDRLVQATPAQAKVLDVGCGAGEPVSRLLAEHFRVVGIDISGEMIRMARRRVPNAEFHVMDMTLADFEECGFDAIISYYAIIHVPRDLHGDLFSRFCRWLKPRGLALLCLGNGDLSGLYEDDFFGARMFWSHFDGEGSLLLLEQAGLSVVQTEIVRDPLGGGAHLFALAERA